MLRTSVDATSLDSGAVVSSYKALAQVERAFRAFNTDLDIRPIRHRTEDRVRAHVLLRMLSYYLSWHLQDHDRETISTDTPRWLIVQPDRADDIGASQGYRSGCAISSITPVVAKIRMSFSPGATSTP